MACRQKLLLHAPAIWNRSDKQLEHEYITCTMGDAFVKTCDPYLAAVYTGGSVKGGQDPTCLSPFLSPLPTELASSTSHWIFQVLSAQVIINAESWS